MMPSAPDHEPEPQSIAVVAHTLLGTMGVIQAALALVLDHREDLGDERITAVLRRAQARAGSVGEVLGELVRGLPPDVLRLLDGELSERRAR